MGNIDCLKWLLGEKIRKVTTGEKKYIKWLQRKFRINLDKEK